MNFSVEQLAQRQVENLLALNPGSYFGEQHPQLTLEQAYAVQRQIVKLRLANGEELGGYKIGCLGSKIRETFGMDGPIRGTLFGNEFHRTGAIISASNFANLAIEGEMGIRIGVDGKPASIFPIIELHHFVLRSEPRSLSELIVNNGLNAGVVLPEKEDVPLNPEHTNLEIEINGQRVDSVPMWGFPGGQDETLDWMNSHLASKGIALKPGQLVLAGTLSDMYPVEKGDEVRVKAGNAVEISISVVQ